jgi:galactose-1-phosphate uridylyltransferase
VRDGWLEEATEFGDVGSAPYEGLRRSVADDPEIRPWRPEGRAAVDPRSGVRTVYSPARARRPHDHPLPPPPEPEDCVVCAGRATTVVDVAPLSRGFTFINKNLYPVVYPREGDAWAEVRDAGGPATGMHFLQWVSTEHDVDLHNAPVEDLAVVVARLAALEDRLYRSEASGMPATGEGRYGHVGVIKNVGRMVGGSLVHGHQQVLHTNVRPLALDLDARFLERTGEPFAEMILRENPEDLTVRDYGDWFRMLVPWFMQRPLDMQIACLRRGVTDLRDLGPEGERALAEALRDAAAAVTSLMPGMGREVAWNMTAHNGVAGGLYVEFLPYTQERGGYECLGLTLCESTPALTATAVRDTLGV